MEPAASFSFEQGKRRAWAIPRSVAPETLNQWTHAGGFVLAVAAGMKMLGTVAGNGVTPQAVGCCVYVASLVALYAASTLSHSFHDARRRNFFRMIDQVCIFLLVVGTYTPFAMVHMQSDFGRLLLAGMWAFAGLGIIARIRSGESGVPPLLYLPLGWLPVLTIGTMYDVGGTVGLGLVLAGGLAYSGGTLLLMNDHRYPYLHAGWHLCTILGSACHFFFVQWYVAEWPIV